MKTWLTYLAAAAMGLAFEFTFKDSAFFVSCFNFSANLVLKMGIFIVFPLVLATMASGTASLSRKRGDTSFVWLSGIFWALMTSALLATVAAFVFRFFPAAFPATSTSPEIAEQADTVYQAMASSTSARLAAANPFSINAFINLFKSSDCLLPVVLLALVLGYALRPTSEIIRPAYITLNSFSEAMFRLAKKVAQLTWIGIFFISGMWFHTIRQDGTVFSSWKFMMLCLITALGMLLVVIPLIYAVFTGFRRNPYRQIKRLFSASTAAFISNNYLFSQSALYTDCRINLGIQKRVVATSLPIHSLVTKGGSALVSTMCTCSLIYAINGTMPTALQTVTLALACTLASFICCLHAGYEVVFVTSFALRLLNIRLSGAEFAILGMLPLINGIALLFDVLLAGLGTSFTAFHLKADCHVRSRDNI